ncbi:hypothetical protein LTR66_002787 [Elasticomyces elasticus]|nr:hypothetical protein LTR28_004856 [Elasticomyces elasticus]KAK4997893.1 hypothetical protein LTR66_002787 [Elasticomyces elasticus]
MEHTNMWRKRALIVLWVLQLICLVIITGLTSYLVAYISNDGDVDVYKNAMIVASVLLTAYAICIVFNIVEIVLFARRLLKPIIYLVLSVLPALFWLVLSCIHIAAWASGAAGYSGSISIVMFLLYFYSTIYGYRIYQGERRARKDRGAYAPAMQPMYPASSSGNPLADTESTAYAGAHQQPVHPAFRQADEHYNPSHQQMYAVSLKDQQGSMYDPAPLYVAQNHAAPQSRYA